jgi:3-hydroxyacyl-CoA dehydrogenase
MTAPLARLARHGDVAVITLDAPPVNALAWPLRRDLRDALQAATADPGPIAIVLQGAERGFCGGGDLRETGGEAALREPRLSEHLLPLLERAGKPVVASIHGFAVGGGLELALACHGRVARADARVGLPESRRGLIALSGTQRLPRALPFERALRLLVDGSLISAAGLADTALFDCVVAADPLIAALDLARELVARPQPLLRARPLQIADRSQALECVAMERQLLSRAGPPEGVDLGAALAALQALEAACDADDFDAGLACADALYLSLHRAHAEAVQAAP